MVSLFDKASQSKKITNKALAHEEFLKRIKKTFYLGPSNPSRMMSQPLAQHVAAHFNETHRNYDLNILDLPTMSKFRQQTPCSLILSMIYVERLLKFDPAYARLISPSELFLVTLMVSTKFYSDYDETEVFMSNWAEEGDVSVERLKQLEIQFLNAIQWNLLVSQDEFYEKLKSIERLLAMKEGLTRNWLTYTELEILMPTLETAKQILNYSTIIMFSYACSVLTIALSCVIASSIPMPLTSSSTATARTSACGRNVTRNALLPDVIISMDDDEQTECINAVKELPAIYDDNLDDFRCNFTFDFLFFNRFIDIPMKRSYLDKNFHFDIFDKHQPTPLVW